MAPAPIIIGISTPQMIGKRHAANARLLRDSPFELRVHLGELSNGVGIELEPDGSSWNMVRWGQALRSATGWPLTTTNDASVKASTSAVRIDGTARKSESQAPGVTVQRT